MLTACALIKWPPWLIVAVFALKSMYVTLPGPCHLASSLLLYRTSSPCSIVSSALFHMLCLSAFLIRSLASYLTNISLALFMAFQFLLTISVEALSNDEAGILLS